MDYKARHRREVIDISSTEARSLKNGGVGELRLLALNIVLVRIPLITSACIVMGSRYYRNKVYAVWSEDLIGM
jgi:hypothetical protein